MSDTYGFGQLTPEDYADDASAVGFIVRQILARVVTAKLVKVAAVHPGDGSPPAAGTVDVIPLVGQMDGNGRIVQHGTVYGLRYLRLQAGPWAIVADPAVDDVGLIVCADRDSTNVASTRQVAPNSRRRFSISDGVYLGGILGAAPKAYFQLKSDGTLKVSDQQGNVLETSSSGFALTGKLAVTGDITATGVVTAGFGTPTQVGLQTHSHQANNAPPTPGT